MEDVKEKRYMKKLLLTCLAALCLVGCSSEPKSSGEDEVKTDTQTTVCKGESPELTIETSFEHDGTKVLKQSNTNTINIEAAGLTSEDIEAAAQSTEANYGAVEGVTYTYSISEEGTFTETTTIDYTIADFTKLGEAGLLTEEAAAADYISIDATIDSLDGTGITCE